jgi:hypothetical protein
MRALIVLSVMAILFSSTACEAGMSTGPHKVAASAPTTSHASHHRGRGRAHYARTPGIVRPIAAVGNAIGSTVGGLFRR